MNSNIEKISNRWLVVPIVLLLAFAAMLTVHLTTATQTDDTAGVACRPICTKFLGGRCVGQWISWRAPYPCYPY